MELMEVCSRHEVHFIADEVYALSVYDDTNTNSLFVSVLSLLPQARQRLLSPFYVPNLKRLF
jgi:aspartate/methionine/tyrosine aminotransferase